MSKRKKSAHASVKKKISKKTCQTNPDVLGLKGDNPSAKGLPSYLPVRRSTRKSSSQYARRFELGVETSTCLSLEKSKTASRPDHKQPAPSIPEKSLSEKSSIHEIFSTSHRNDKRKTISKNSNQITSNTNSPSDFSIKPFCNVRTIKKNHGITKNKNRKSGCSPDISEISRATEFNPLGGEIEICVISQSSKDGGIRKKGRKSIGEKADISECSLEKPKRVKSEVLSLSQINNLDQQGLEPSAAGDDEEKQINIEKTQEKSNLDGTDCSISEHNQRSGYSYLNEEKDSCCMPKATVLSLLPAEVTQFCSNPSTEGHAPQTDLDPNLLQKSAQIQNVSQQNSTNACSERRDDRKKESAAFVKFEVEPEDGSTSTELAFSKSEAQMAPIRHFSTDTNATIEIPALSKTDLKCNIEAAEISKTDKVFCHVSALVSNNLVKVPQVNNFIQNELPRATGIKCVTSPDHMTINGSFLAVSKAWHILHKMKKSLPSNELVHINLEHQQDHDYDQSTKSLKVMWAEPNGECHELPIETVAKGMYVVKKPEMTRDPSQLTGKSNQFHPSSSKKNSQANKGDSPVKPNKMKENYLAYSKGENHNSFLKMVDHELSHCKGYNHRISDSDIPMVEKELSGFKGYNSEIQNLDIPNPNSDEIVFQSESMFSENEQSKNMSFDKTESVLKDGHEAEYWTKTQEVHSDNANIVLSDQKILHGGQNHEDIHLESSDFNIEESSSGLDPNNMEHGSDAGKEKLVMITGPFGDKQCILVTMNPSEVEEEEGTQSDRNKGLLNSVSENTEFVSDLKHKATDDTVHQINAYDIASHKHGDFRVFQKGNQKNKCLVNEVMTNDDNARVVQSTHPETSTSFIDQGTVTDVCSDLCVQDTNDVCTAYSETEPGNPAPLQIETHKTSSEIKQNVLTSPEAENCQPVLEVGQYSYKRSVMDDGIPEPSSVTQHISTASKLAQSDQQATIARQHNTTICEDEQNISRFLEIGHNVPVSSDASQTIPRSPELNQAIPRSSYASQTIKTSSEVNQTITKSSEENQTIPRSSETNSNIHRLSKVSQTVQRLLEVGQDIPPKEVKLKCSRCPASFTEFSQLKQHECDEHGSEIHHCGTCGKSFREKRYLHAHLNRHFGLKKHVCSICGWKFFERHKLLLHLETHKSVDKRRLPYRCLICLHQFHNRATWSDHLNTHTGAKPFACSVCQAKFAHRIGLKRHQLVHEKESRFKCSFCGKGFKLKTKLQEHVTVHTGKGRHVCHVCSKVFTASMSLKRHLYTVHGETGDIFVEESSLSEQVFTADVEADSSSAAKDTLFMCWRCGSMFETLRDLEGHASVLCQPQVKLEVIDTSSGDPSHPVAMDTTLVIHQSEQPEDGDNDDQLQSLLSSLQNPEGGNSVGLRADNSTLDEVEQMKLAASTLADLYSYAQEIKKEKD